MPKLIFYMKSGNVVEVDVKSYKIYDGYKRIEWVTTDECENRLQMLKLEEVEAIVERKVESE